MAWRPERNLGGEVYGVEVAGRRGAELAGRVLLLVVGDGDPHAVIKKADWVSLYQCPRGRRAPRPHRQPHPSWGSASMTAGWSPAVTSDFAVSPLPLNAELRTPIPAELIADVQVWCAAIQLNPSDLRPTGPPQHSYASRIWQQQLDKRLAATDSRADRDLQRLLATEVPSTTADPFLPELADRLRNVARAGLDATFLVQTAAAAGPLPDDHPAAALWWRILDQLSQQTPNHHPPPARQPQRRGP
jgi:hypothetical protein